MVACIRAARTKRRHVEGQGADVSGWVVVRQMTWPRVSLSMYTQGWQRPCFLSFLMNLQVSISTARIRSNG